MQTYKPNAGEHSRVLQGGLSRGNAESRSASLHDMRCAQVTQRGLLFMANARHAVTRLLIAAA